MTPSDQTIKIISQLARGKVAVREQQLSGWGVPENTGGSRIANSEAEVLIAEGVLGLKDGKLHARPEAKAWLRKMRLASAVASGSKSVQPRPPVNLPTINAHESPLSRLALQKDKGAAFLSSELVAAGDRFRQLFERAQMQPRITMSYDSTHLVDKGAPTSGNPLGDMGHDARLRMNSLLSKLPQDAASAVLNVCGFQKGIQQLEIEKNWPRRSGKMILRMGLEILAQELGLVSNAQISRTTKTKLWRPQESVPRVLR